MTDPGGSWHVVFGATGAIGGAVVGELVRAGWQVRAVSRGGPAGRGAQRGPGAGCARTGLGLLRPARNRLDRGPDGVRADLGREEAPIARPSGPAAHLPLPA